MEFFDSYPPLADTLTRIRREVQDLGRHLREFAPELKGDRSLDKGDHGIIAAENLIAQLEQLGGGLADSYRPAARAIAFHNTHFPIVRAKNDPVAALLILCDQVQDWQRSALGFDRAPAVVLSRIVHALPPDENQFGPVRRFDLSFQRRQENPSKPATNQWVVDSDAGRPSLTIELTYGPGIIGTNLRDGFVVLSPGKEKNIPYLWGGAVSNLQRVDFDGWKVNLFVVYRTPKPTGFSLWTWFEKRVREQNTNALAEGPKSRQNIAALLLPWFDERDHGISYSRSDDPQTETLKLDLIKLGVRFADNRPVMGLGHISLSRVLG